jgi:hypothetical protein
LNFCIIPCLMVSSPSNEMRESGFGEQAGEILIGDGVRISTLPSPGIQSIGLNEILESILYNV